MKTLIDTCVWSLALRRNPGSSSSPEELQLIEALSQAVRDGSAVIIGPIRQEILSGIKNGSQFEKLRQTLQSFRDEPVLSTDYEEAARLYNLCRTRGIQSSPTDILLCAVAARRKWTMLTNDRGLQACMKAITSHGE